MIMAEKNKGGRKGKYETCVKPYFNEIKEWCRTMTEKQIAEKLGIGESTFAVYKNKYPELKEVLIKGRRDLVVELRGALIKRAKGYDYTETKTVTQKVKWPDELYSMLLDAGFSEEQIEQSELVKTEVAKKQMPPDVAALNLALKNYDKENWANDPAMLDLKKEQWEFEKKMREKNDW